MELTKKWILLLFLLPTLFLIHGKADGNNRKGEWKLLRHSIGISAMHMLLLPNDKIIAYDRTDAGRSNISLPVGKCTNMSSDCTAHAIEFDPASRRVRPLTITTDTFCSSGALSSNGTLIQTGGYGKGERVVRYFSPCDDCDWIENENGLAARRWYASDQILPDGRVFVVGGRQQFSYEFVPSAEKKATFHLQFLKDTYDGPNLENNLYPFVHLSTDGNLFIFANSRSILLDYVKDRVVKFFPELSPGISRNYPSSGSSVLLPLRLDHDGTNVKAEIMVCGGADKKSFPNAEKGIYLAADSSCGRLVITDKAPSWEIEQMPLRRAMGDMIMLPTGDVLIINGVANGTAGWKNGREPVFSPVLYRTGTMGNASRVFETMNPSGIPRVYHSTAHLIADGRVLISGSNAYQRYTFIGVPYPTEMSMEAFSPPYIGGPRPNITYVAPGADFGYGERFQIGFTTNDLVDIADVFVTMVAPSFTTHSFSMNQRLLVLETEGSGKARGGQYQLEGVAPASAVLAPPGYYLVFVVHRGVPSKGIWVRIS